MAQPRRVRQHSVLRIRRADETFSRSPIRGSPKHNSPVKLGRRPYSHRSPGLHETVVSLKSPPRQTSPSASSSSASASPARFSSPSASPSSSLPVANATASVQLSLDYDREIFSLSKCSELARPRVASPASSSPSTSRKATSKIKFGRPFKPVALFSKDTVGQESSDDPAAAPLSFPHFVQVRHFRFLWAGANAFVGQLIFSVLLFSSLVFDRSTRWFLTYYAPPPACGPT